MTISEVSEMYGVSPDTLRYYERVGLIPYVPRKASGIRDYDENSCRWVQFIRCMRNAGLQVEALVEYVTLFEQGDHTKSARKIILQEQREALIQRIEAMQISLKHLDEKLENYSYVEAFATKLYVK